MLKYLVLLVVDAFLYFSSPYSMDRSFMTICAVLAAVKVVLVFFEGKSKVFDLRKIYLRHSTVFALCFFIVFFQCDIDYILGIADIGDYFVYNPVVVCKAMALSNMALTTFLLGYSNGKTKERLAMASHSNLKRRIINSFGNKMFLNYFVFIIILVYLTFFSNTGYNQEGWEKAGVIIGYTVAFFVAIFVAYSMDYREGKNMSWFFHMRIPLLLILVFLLIVILTGRRTEVVRCGFLILCSYLFVKKDKANYKFIITASIIGLLLISTTAIIRQSAGTTLRESLVILQDTKSVFPPTKELSTSVNTLHIAMTEFPERTPFNLGSSFFSSFLKIVPGLTGLVQFVSGEKFVGSEVIITDVYFGSKYHGWGLGSSIIADVYISFGTIGVIIVFFLFGRFVRWLEVKTYNVESSVYIVALSFSCYSQLMFACRSGLGILFLCWAYSCILLVMVKNHFNRTIEI